MQVLSYGSQLIPSELLFLCQAASPVRKEERKRLSNQVNQPINKPTQSSDHSNCIDFPKFRGQDAIGEREQIRDQETPWRGGQESYFCSHEMKEACLPSSLLPTLASPVKCKE